MKAIKYFILLITEGRVTREQLAEIGISRYTAYRIKKGLIEEGYLNRDGSVNTAVLTPRKIGALLVRYSISASGKKDFDEIRELMLDLINRQMVEPVEMKARRLAEEQEKIIKEARATLAAMDARLSKAAEDAGKLEELRKRMKENMDESEKVLRDLEKILYEIKKTREPDLTAQPG